VSCHEKARRKEKEKGERRKEEKGVRNLFVRRKVSEKRKV